MFLSETHQPQLLDANSYCTPSAFASERASILEPAWHCVGTTTDLPHDGDFLTLVLLQRPMIVRRDGDDIHAYLNVCTHRFCTLTDRERGNAPKLKCQYHGWEYDADGQTKRIPDAPSFKPLKKGELGLTKFRCQTKGHLIFVTLDAEAPPLDDYLDGRGQHLEDWFNNRWTPMMSYEETIDCNWKTYLENGLESYHIDTVHKATLVRRPQAENCLHDLGTTSTKFTDTGGAPDPSAQRLDRWMHRLLELDPEPYQHIHVYPTLTFIRLAMFSYLESVIPVSAEQTRVITRGFAYRGRRDRFYTPMLGVGLRRWGSRFLKQIQDEDVDILRLNQAGIRSPQRPRGGLISSREERIHHFQRYIVSSLST